MAGRFTQSLERITRLGPFAERRARSRQRRGHVFQGRYQSAPVTGTAADASYFRIVADYLHLNPARAAVAGF